MKLSVLFSSVFLGIGSLAFSEAPQHTIELRGQTVSFHSQASQDQLVYYLLYGLLGKEDPGYYLEIGAGEPIYINNTYFFEKNLNWEGVSIDISEELYKLWYPQRNNLLLAQDALRTNYSSVLQSFPKVIDYLTLDVDGLYDVVLRRIPLDKYTFKVITIEHDFYRYGDMFRKKEREILTARGYHLLCEDVSNNGYIFEDWWIHPSAFPEPVFSRLQSLDLKGKEHSEIIQQIQSVLP